jgi:hypothetical protein
MIKSEIYSKSYVFCFNTVVLNMTSRRHQKALLPQCFDAHGQTLKIGKFVNLERRIVNEKKSFDL